VGFVVDKVALWQVFSVLQFPLPIFILSIAPQSPSSIIWGLYNRPEVAAVPRNLVQPHKISYQCSTEDTVACDNCNFRVLTIGTNNKINKDTMEPRIGKRKLVRQIITKSTIFWDWIGGLDDVEKRKFVTLPGLELRPLSRPALPSYTDYAIPARG
jgi:hypothetical protein